MKSIIKSSAFIICLMGIYNILVFCLNPRICANFWICYAFVMFSMIAVLASFIIVNLDKNRKVVGLPITVISIYYCALQTILGTVLMSVAIVVNTSIIIQSIIALIFLGVYVPALVGYLSGANLKKKKKNQLK